MLIAHYVGPAKSGILAFAGWHLTVLGQKAPFDLCTHTEAIHAVNEDGTFTIASASLHDKGVRIKENVRLAHRHWLITDVPQWECERSVEWFDWAIANNLRFDKRGALATLLPGRQEATKVFCTESVLAPFVKAAHYYSPALGLSLCLSIGKDVTQNLLHP